MSLLVILAVDDETDVSEELHSDLTKRYSADYAIRSATSPEEALDWLRQAQEVRSVAVVIASLRMAAMSGIDLLIRAHELHPEARRALLIRVGDRGSKSLLERASTLNPIQMAHEYLSERSLVNA